MGFKFIQKSLKLVYFFKKSSFLLLGIEQTNRVYNNNDDQNCKFLVDKSYGLFLVARNEGYSVVNIMLFAKY